MTTQAEPSGRVRPRIASSLHRPGAMRAVENGDATDRETMLLFGGVALAIFGAGLILSNRNVRQLLGQIRPTDLIQTAVPDVAREANIDPDTGVGASLTLQIAAGSLELVDDVSSRDREEIESIRRDQVLETSEYPTITDDSPTSATTAKRTGDGQPTSARAIVSPATVRAYGEFSVRQTDYGIRLVTAAAGAIKVKDELTISFDIVANVSSDSR